MNTPTTEQLQAENAELRCERDELAAHLYEFKKLVDMDGGKAIDRLIELVNGAPAQSLAERDAEVAKKAFIAGVYAFDGVDSQTTVSMEDIDEAAEQYATKLREQTK